MKYSNFIAHAATGEEGNSFVGIKIKDNQVHFYYPESYDYDENEFDRDAFLDILKSISLAKSNAESEDNAMSKHMDNSEFAVLSYIWIIEDYLKNGLLVTLEKEHKLNHSGKVIWKKTFELQPIISNGNVVFSQMIMETKSRQESIITEAYAYCVKKSLRFLGWMYGISDAAIENETYYENKETEYLEAIRRELDRTFDDTKRMRLQHMENVMVGLDELSSDNTIVYGVESYHYVFERMIDAIFGNEDVRDYYPSFKWHLTFSKSQEGLSGPTIRPDTVLRDNNKIYIIDSKYYRYGMLNISETKGLPEAASIVKQITYGSYVSVMNKDLEVYNVFLLPCKYSRFDEYSERNGVPMIFAGYVSSDWEIDKTYGKIYTFLIDLKYVIKTWNRIDHEDVRRQLIDEHNEKTLASRL